MKNYAKIIEGLKDWCVTCPLHLPDDYECLDVQPCAIRDAIEALTDLLPKEEPTCH